MIIAGGASGGVFGLFLVLGAFVAFATLLVLKKNHRIVPIAATSVKEHDVGSRSERSNTGLDSLVIEDLDS